MGTSKKEASLEAEIREAEKKFDQAHETLRDVESEWLEATDQGVATLVSGTSDPTAWIATTEKLREAIRNYRKSLSELVTLDEKKLEATHGSAEV